MKYPDIRTYRENIRQNYITPLKDRQQFLGRSALDNMLKRKSPSVNIKKDDPIYTLEVALPGFTKECISINVHDDVLSIRAERSSDACPFPESDYLIQEFNRDIVERTVKLGKEIGHEEISATFKNGLLEIKFHDVPKEEEEKIKKVFVH